MRTVALAVLLLATIGGTAHAQDAAATRLTFVTRDGQTPTVFGHRSGEHGWRRVCTVPCARRFALGEYALALSLDAEREPVAVAGPPLVVTGTRHDLVVRFDDGDGRRVAGGVLTAFGVVVLGAAAGFAFLTFLAAFVGEGYLVAAAITTALTFGSSVAMIGAGIAMLGAGATATARVAGP